MEMENSSVIKADTTTSELQNTVAHPYIIHTHKAFKCWKTLHHHGLLNVVLYTPLIPYYVLACNVNGVKYVRALFK